MGRDGGDRMTYAEVNGLAGKGPVVGALKESEKDYDYPQGEIPGNGKDNGVNDPLPGDKGSDVDMYGNKKFDSNGTATKKKKKKTKTGNPTTKKQKTSKEDVAKASLATAPQMILTPEERRRQRNKMPGMGGMVGKAESMQ